MGYACKLSNSSIPELIRTQIASFTYSSTTATKTITMSSLGYVAKDYTEWTVNNFAYKVSNVGAQQKEKDYSGTLTNLRATCYVNNPTLSYTASSGTLTVSKCYSQANAVAVVGGSNKMQAAYGYPTITIYLYTVK